MVDRSGRHRTSRGAHRPFSLFSLAAALRSALSERMHALRWAAFVLWASFAAAGLSQAAERQPLDILSKNGKHAFSVEMAQTDAERSKGLMYRKELPQGQGMLFDFQREQEVSMWMKNTYISLDMLFIQADGRILRIAENTEPLSLRIISSGGPVRAVLEVIGGTAKKLGIAPGDQVMHPIFNER